MIIQSKETEESHTQGKETAKDAGKVFMKLHRVSRGPMPDFDLGRYICLDAACCLIC